MTLSSTYLQDKVDYIDKESGHHGLKKLFALCEIERAQYDLLALSNQHFFEKQDILYKHLKGSIFDKILARLQIWKLEYQVSKDKRIMQRAKQYIEKMYGVSELELTEIQDTGYRLTADW